MTAAFIINRKNRFFGAIPESAKNAENVVTMNFVVADVSGAGSTCRRMRTSAISVRAISTFLSTVWNV